jgi:hypothetical protein
MEKKQDLTPPKAKRTPPSSSAVSNGQDRPKQETNPEGLELNREWVVHQDFKKDFGDLCDDTHLS